MSGASSTVSSMVNSGAISTKPPMLATTMMAEHEADRVAFQPVVGIPNMTAHSAGCAPAAAGDRLVGRAALRQRGSAAGSVIQML